MLLAIVGGLLGIIGAIIQEVQSTTTYILLPFLGAPIIEEALKPSGIYLALLWWPRAMRSQIVTALLCALSGLVFGIIESFVYVTLYVEDPSDEFIVFRFSVPLGLHVACSYLVGLGLNQHVIDWAAGRSEAPARQPQLFHLRRCPARRLQHDRCYPIAQRSPRLRRLNGDCS